MIDSVAGPGRPGVDARDRRRAGPLRRLHARGARRLPAGERRRSSPTCAPRSPTSSGVVGKLTQGAADAGFVYASDVARRATAQLEAIELPAGLQPDGRLRRRRRSRARRTRRRRGASSTACSRATAPQALAAAGFESARRTDAAGRRPGSARCWPPRWRCALAFLTLPIVAIFVDGPPGELVASLGEPGARDALWLSLETTAIAARADLVLVGTPAAYLLATRELPRPARSSSR